MTQTTIDRILKMYDRNCLLKDIAQITGVTVGSVGRVITENGRPNRYQVAKNKEVNEICGLLAEGMTVREIADSSNHHRTRVAYIRDYYFKKLTAETA